MGDSVVSQRFEGLELKAKIAKGSGKEYNPKTLILQRKMPDGLYWKDVRVDYLSIGYLNVPENRKLEFDKTLRFFIMSN